MGMLGNARGWKSQAIDLSKQLRLVAKKMRFIRIKARHPSC